MLLMRTAIMLSAVSMLIEGEATADPVLRLIAMQNDSLDRRIVGNSLVQVYRLKLKALRQ